MIRALSSPRCARRATASTACDQGIPSIIGLDEKKLGRHDG